ncbi:MAG: MFS transporter [Pseudomonadota bacterium]|nr:MFS transporter [Pseudomonadota bacterium]
MQAWRDLWNLPRSIWVLFFATLVNRTGTMALPFLVLYLTRDAGFSVSEAGAVLAAYGGVALLMGPIAGRLIDRVGARRVMQASLALTGLLQVAFPLASTPTSVVLLTMAWSATSEAYRPAGLSVTAELVEPGQRRQAYALIRMAINLGMSIGPAVGGLLAAWDFRAVFVVDGITSLLAAAVLIGVGLGGVAPAKGGSGDAVAAEAPVVSAPSDGLVALRDPRMRAFLVGLVVLAMVAFQGESSMAVFLVDDLGLSTTTYGLLFTINTVLIVALEVPLTAAIARWDPHRTLALGAFLYALGFGALGLVHDVWGVIASVVVWSFGEMVFSPTSTAYVAEVAPEGQRGQYMGLYTSGYALAFMLAPLLGMLSLEHLGAGPHWALVFVAGSVATAILYGGAVRGGGEAILQGAEGRSGDRVG